MSGENQKFVKAYKAIDDAYNIEIQDAKRNKCVAITEVLTKALTDMIGNESDRIISEIKDDTTDINIIEQITCTNLYFRLVQSIKNPLTQLRNTDIEMDEVENSDTNSD